MEPEGSSPDGWVVPAGALDSAPWQNLIEGVIADAAFPLPPSAHDVAHTVRAALDDHSAAITEAELMARIREDVQRRRDDVARASEQLKALPTQWPEPAGEYRRAAAASDAAVEAHRRLARRAAERDVARVGPAHRRHDRDVSNLTLVEAMQVVVPRLIRACTPSVLPHQAIPDDPRASDISVSFDGLGSPLSGLGHFERISRTVCDFYGARRAWPLVSGSTGANWIIARWLSYRLEPGQVVLVGRGSHVSVPQALTDFGVPWAYLEPEYLPEYEAVLPPSARAVQRALAAHPNVAAVWLNGPSYEGVALDTQAIHEVLAGAGQSILLIVDEAWGSHLPAHPSLRPLSAIEHADVLCASTHKQAGGLQGTAVLVTGPRSRADDAEIDASFRSMCTTSPSYLLLGSIESTYGALTADARYNGGQLVGNLIGLAARLHQQISLRDVAGVLTDFATDVRQRGISRLDPLKVTVGVRRLRATGVELAQALVARGVIAEKAGINAITFLVTFQMARDDIDTLADRLARAITACGGVAHVPREPLPNPFEVAPAEVVMNPREAALAGARARERVELGQANGRVAAERLAAYPPGVPVVVEGQRVSQAQIDYLSAVQASGGHLLANRSGGHDAASGAIYLNVLTG